MKFRSAVSVLIVALLAAPAVVADDSCEYANDGECDVLVGLCATSTDDTDCEGFVPDNSCEYAFHGECDERRLCSIGTDDADCRGGQPVIEVSGALVAIGHVRYPDSASGSLLHAQQVRETMKLLLLLQYRVELLNDRLVLRPQLPLGNLTNPAFMKHENDVMDLLGSEAASRVDSFLVVTVTAPDALEITALS